MFNTPPGGIALSGFVRSTDTRWHPSQSGLARFDTLGPALQQEISKLYSPDRRNRVWGTEAGWKSNCESDSHPTHRAGREGIQVMAVSRAEHLHDAFQIFGAEKQRVV